MIQVPSSALIKQNVYLLKDVTLLSSLILRTKLSLPVSVIIVIILRE